MTPNKTPKQPKKNARSSTRQKKANLVQASKEPVIQANTVPEVKPKPIPAQVTELHNEVNGLNRKINDTLAEISQNVNTISSNIAQREQDINSLKENITQHDQAVGRLNQNLSEHGQTLNQIRQEFETHRRTAVTASSNDPLISKKGAEEIASAKAEEARKDASKVGMYSATWSVAGAAFFASLASGNAIAMVGTGFAGLVLASLITIKIQEA